MVMMQISVPLIGQADEKNALHCALQLAKDMDAAISGSFFRPSFTMQEMEHRFQTMERYDYYGYPNIIHEFKEAFQQYEGTAEAKAKHYFDTHITEYKQKHSENKVHTAWAPTDFALPFESYLRRLSILSDMLVISGLLVNENSYKEMLTQLLMVATKPVMVVPTVAKWVPLADATLVIGWEPTPSSMRAVTLAMPMLRRAKTVYLVSLEGPHSGPVAMEEFSQFLISHHINALVHTPKPSKVSLEEMFLSAIQHLKADMVIMGAFSHTRLRDWILGNTTHYMLSHATVPLCLTH